MTRQGFTAFELLITISVITVLGGLSIFSYRYVHFMSDLDRSADQVVGALHRAKHLATVNEHDSSWGFLVSPGVLYRGISFLQRDVSFDEVYPLAGSVTASGLSEVSFSRLHGEPSATGSIVLTSLNGAQRIITVIGGQDGIILEELDLIMVCHTPPGGGGEPNTLSLPESAWPAHREHGDKLGACP